MAVETQVSPTPVTNDVATPAMQEPTTSVNGTAEPSDGNSVGVEAQPAEEQFGGVDIKSLPKEIQSLLKEKHDAMLRDYKEKTTKLSEERKGFEPVSKKAEALDQLLQDQTFIDWWNSKNAPPETQKELTPEEQLVQKVQTIEQELLHEKANATVVEFAEAVDDKGQKLRPDFDELSNTGLINGYLQLNPAKGKQDFQSKLNEAYVWVKEAVAPFIEKGRKMAIEEMQRKASNGTLPPQSGVKGTYDGPDPRKASVNELVEMARKGIRVPRY